MYSVDGQAKHVLLCKKEATPSVYPGNNNGKSMYTFDSSLLTVHGTYQCHRKTFLAKLPLLPSPQTLDLTLSCYNSHKHNMSYSSCYIIGYHLQYTYNLSILLVNTLIAICRLKM